MVQPRSRRSSATFGSTVRLINADPLPRVCLFMGVGSFARISNARVAGRPLLKSATVKAPFSIAFNAHDRAAAWNQLRHDGRQNRCDWPPLRASREIAGLTL